MSDESMREIVERIKNRRIELDYSFQDLADLTGMSKSTLQRYETGSIKNIPLDKLKDLAKALKVTPEWIMGWESSKPNNKYYLNDDVAEIAQEIYEDKDLKMLFDASRKVSKDDMQLVIDMVKRLKGDE
nr:helix-turn-helix transcriptional regulator [uncultured Aminipila sp.]